MYWVETDGVSTGGIYKVSPAGGSVVPLATDPATGSLALAGGNVFFASGTTLSGTTPALRSVPAAGGTTIWWSDGGSDLDIIRRAPAAGGPFVSLTGYINAARWSALDASFVYWNDGRRIYKTAR